MKHEDLYILDELRSDKSFREKVSGLDYLFGGNKKQREERLIWERGVKNGFYKGIQYVTNNYSILDIGNAESKEQKEFTDKLYKLCGEYGFKISWHPTEGMVLQKL